MPYYIIRRFHLRCNHYKMNLRLHHRRNSYKINEICMLHKQKKIKNDYHATVTLCCMLRSICIKKKLYAEKWTITKVYDFVSWLEYRRCFSFFPPCRFTHTQISWAKLCAIEIVQNIKIRLKNSQNIDCLSYHQYPY